MTKASRGLFRDDPAAGDRPPDALSILCVLPTLNPYGGVVSIVNALNILIDAGYRVTIVSLSRVGSDQLFSKTEPVFIEDWDRIPETVVGRFDIVLATSWETVVPVVALAERLPGSAPFYFVQDFEADFYPEGDRDTRGRVLATYDMIPNRIVKTEHLRRRLAAHGWESHKISPGMNLDLFYRRPNVARVRESVLAMARPDTPDDHRGYEVLVRVFEEVRRRRPHLERWVFGSEDLPGMDSCVRNLGRLRPDELPALYSSASAFIDTSRTHGFGRTGLEAMSCGVPCVLSDSGGITEYARHNENCLIVPVGDIDASVTALGQLLDDPALAGRLAEEGLRTAGRYSDYVAAHELVSVFHKVLARQLRASTN